MSQNREAMKLKSKRDAYNYQICLNMFTDTFPDLKSKVANAKDRLSTSVLVGYILLGYIVGFYLNFF